MKLGRETSGAGSPEKLTAKQPVWLEGLAWGSSGGSTGSCVEQANKPTVSKTRRERMVTIAAGDTTETPRHAGSRTPDAHCAARPDPSVPPRE